jgi:hypothetical protein
MMNLQQVIKETNETIVKRLRVLEAAERGLHGNNAGADTRVVGTQLGRAGKGLLLFSSTGALLREFVFSDDGMHDALAATSYGDVLELPAGTITSSFEIPSGVTIHGRARDASIINGRVLLNDAASLENLSVIRIERQVVPLVGIEIGAVGTSRLVNVVSRIENLQAGARAIEMLSGGNLDAYDAVLVAQIGYPGYAAYVTSGIFYHYSGRAVGSATLYPYFS